MTLSPAPLPPTRLGSEHIGHELRQSSARHTRNNSPLSKAPYALRWTCRQVLRELTKIDSYAYPWPLATDGRWNLPDARPTDPPI